VLSIGADQPDFTDTDAFVDAMVSGANTLSLSLSKRARIRSRAQRGKMITQRTQIVNSIVILDRRTCLSFETRHLIFEAGDVMMHANPFE
jgi:hypothetical protein